MKQSDTISTTTHNIIMKKLAVILALCGFYTWGATWSKGDGLPAGLVLNSSEKITGHPTVAGDFTFTVTAKLGNASASRVLSLTINLMEITTKELPGVQEGEAYSAQFESNGENLKWSKTTGEFSDGLTIDEEDGVISGTATKGGEFKFTIYASNEYASTSKELKISIPCRSDEGNFGGRTKKTCLPVTGDTQIVKRNLLFYCNHRIIDYSRIEPRRYDYALAFRDSIDISAVLVHEVYSIIIFRRL